MRSPSGKTLSISGGIEAVSGRERANDRSFGLFGMAAGEKGSVVQSLALPEARHRNSSGPKRRRDGGYSLALERMAGEI